MVPFVSWRDFLTRFRASLASRGRSGVGEIGRSTNDDDRRSIELYHRWYYETFVWKRTTYRGISILKWPGDLWGYQEIMTTLRPALVVEF